MIKRQYSVEKCEGDVQKGDNMKVKEFIKDEAIYTVDNLINSPIISVILPTYCRGDNGLLERAIRTVMNQRFTDWELVVVDDGSKDSTRTVVEKLMREDNRIIYIRNDINSGIPAIRANQGILHARGRYIAYQFDDDQWYDNMLHDLYSEIKGLGDNALVYGKSQIIYPISKCEVIMGEKFNSRTLQKMNIIPNHAVLHSKEIPYLYGGYDCHVAFKRLCDWDLWRRWTRYVPMLFVDSLVGKIEIGRAESLTKTAIYNQDIMELRLRVDRCKELSLYNIEEYEVDNVYNTKSMKLQQQLYNEHIEPWRKAHYIKNN